MPGFRSAMWLAIPLFLLAPHAWGAERTPDDAAKPPDAALAAPSGAGAAPEYVTREDLDALKDILDEQIKRGVTSKYTVNLSGFGILGYYASQRNANNFGINSAGLALTGNLREDPLKEGDLKYRVGLLYLGTAPNVLTSASATSVTTINPDNTAATTTTVKTASTQASSPVLSDVFLVWDLLAAKGSLEPPVTVSATFGQQLVPFGQDNFATEDKLPTVKKAQYVSALGIGRDIGLKLEGGFINRHDPASGITTPLFAYTLALFNGSGANRNDDNQDKDFVGKLIVSPAKEYFSFFRGLKFGGSFYGGRAGAKGTAKTVRERIGAELEWLRKPFLVTGEYVLGRDDRRKSRGAVATLFWTPGTLPDFQPLVRYDRFDPDVGKSGDATTVVTVGFNYFLYQLEPITRRTYEVIATERVVKLQLNYNFIREQGVKVKNDEWIAQAVFSF